MKTSSLPNSKHKDGTVELDILPPTIQTTIDNQGVSGPTDVHKRRVVDQEDVMVSGVYNIAYRDSPSNEKTKGRAERGQYLHSRLR